MAKRHDIANIEFQKTLEEAVLNYQNCLNNRTKAEADAAYEKITKLYNPLDYSSAWYEAYKYFFDSKEDFESDYIRVFITVLSGWKPREQRKTSRYGGSGEFKNYFIGSLYHNYTNLVKSDQAAKRNVTNRCPICSEWVSPISTHLMAEHSFLLWDALDEMNVDIESLSSCPICNNFKINKSPDAKIKVVEQIKAHFISKHSSILFNRFNDLYPEISTLSPRIVSTNISDQSTNNNSDVDIYEVTEGHNNLINNLSLLNLTDIQENIVRQALNGESTMVYKPEKYKCTKEEWENALEKLKEAIRICGYEH